MTEHSPTPWLWVDLTGDDETQWWLNSTSGETILFAAEHRNLHIKNANAEFMIRAVNSHDDLVAALEELTDAYLQLHASGVSVTNRSAYFRARNALAKARGEQVAS